MKVATKETFKEIVLEAPGLILVDFWASWCGPCRLIGPILEEIAVEYPNYTIVKVNVDENQELAMEYGVRSIPTLIIFENGKVKNVALGYRPKEAILELFL